MQFLDKIKHPSFFDAVLSACIAASFTFLMLVLAPSNLVTNTICAVFTPFFAAPALRFIATNIYDHDAEQVKRKTLIYFALLIALFPILAAAPPFLNSFSYIQSLYTSPPSPIELITTYQQVILLLLASIIVLLILWNRYRDTPIGKIIAETGLESAGSNDTNENEFDYTHRVHTRISANIEGTKHTEPTATLRILVISGVMDFRHPESTCIPDAIEKTKPHIRALLLDPFSTFAKERAEVLRQYDSREDTYLRYVYNYLRTIDWLTDLQSRKLSVDWRIYCSRPLHRFYYGERTNGTSWCVTQSYPMHCHGHVTPYYHYESSPRVRDYNSGITLMRQAFQYIWDRGFSSYDSSDLADSPLLFYMANMQGISIYNSKNTLKRPTTILKEIQTSVNTAFKQARDKFGEEN